MQDAFANGDVFDVFDNAVKIGSTSVVPASGNCGSDPAVCALDPNSSRGVFLLAGGQSHSITIQPSASPFGAGAAYFRVDAGVPVPTLSEWAIIAMTTLLVGFGLWSLRGRTGFGGRSA